MTATLWWGTYPEAGLGTEPGLGEALWRWDDTGPTPAITLPSPSFITAHPELPIVYALTETTPSTLVAIDVADPADPRIVATVPTGGDGGCHLTLSRDARCIYVSHYGTGELSVIALSDSGEPAAEPAQVWAHQGAGPRADRQEGPHAHFSGYSPGDTHLLVCDLGTDELRSYRIGPDGLLSEPTIAATFPGGAGPRHFVARGSLLYVVCELDHHLRTVRWEPASASAAIIAEQPTTLAPLRSDTTIYDAHIDLVDDTLLVSVRGCDVISVFDLAPEGEAHYRAAFDAGTWPRFFAAIGDHLWVGAEKGHEIRRYALADVAALAPETESGAIATVPHEAWSVPSPACVVSR